MTTLALDGKCMLAKAAFATPTSIRSPEGLAVNGLLGFGLMQLKLIGDHPSSSFVVVFDSGLPSFRSDLFPNYKVGRPRLPEDFGEQLTLAKTLSRLFGFSVIEPASGLEADDALASLARQAEQQQTNLLIVTSDKDLLQVVRDPFVRVLLSRRGASDLEAYDEALVEFRFGVPPVHFPDLRALSGDPSDNIDGIRGVGLTTARRLVAAYGGIDQILSRVSEITGSLGARLASEEGRLRLNRRLLELCPPPAIPLTQEPLDISRLPTDEIRTFSESLGLPTLARRADLLVGRASEKRSSRTQSHFNFDR